MLWNDPSVLKEGAVYRMWMGGGDPSQSVIHVRIYEAQSTDGLNWNINSVPQLDIGASGTWDAVRVETPSVIKVGSTYHMYYTGCDTDSNCDAGIFQIGHATSSDGISWVKDPANPIITTQGNPTLYGFYTVAEPAAVYNPSNGKIHLYYTGAKSGVSGSPSSSQWAILLATSNNGSTFTHFVDGSGHRRAVLEQSINYPFSAGYIGYSTPFAFIDSNGRVQLFHDVISYTSPADQWRQTALARAVSSDGFAFSEQEFNLFTTANFDWASFEIRAPAVLQDADQLKMWFAGNSVPPFDTNFKAGIGLATQKHCP